MASLVLVATGLFLPQLTDAFRVKNHVVSMGGYLLWLLWLAQRPAAVVRLPAHIRIALTGCVTAIVVSTLAAAQPIIAWHASLELLPLGLLFCLLINQDDRGKTARALGCAWLVAALVVAVLALQQSFAPHWLDLGLAANGKLTAFSTLGNPIWASIVLVVVLPLAMEAARKGPPLLWLLPPVLAAALWTTQSRQAWLALVLMGWIAVIWKGGGWPRHLAVASLVLLLCTLPFVDFSADAFHSLNGRLLIMRGAWQIFFDHPLTGLGLGHVGAAYPAYQAALLADPTWQTYASHAAVIDDTHNEFLQWAATTGALGFVGFTLLCATVAWLGWRSPHVRTYLWHWYLGYVGLLITLLLTGIQAQSALGLLLVCCLAVVLAGALPPGMRQPLARNTALVAAATSVVLAVLAGQWALQDLRAGYLEGQGDRLMQERDAWLARQSYAQALAIDANRGSLLKKHASIFYLEGRYTEALAELSRAKTYSGDTGASLLEAEILATMGRDTEAVTAYRSLVASFPQLLSPHFILGQLYYRQRQYGLARMELQRVVEIAPSAFNLQATQEKVQRQKEMAAAFIKTLDHR